MRWDKVLMLSLLLLAVGCLFASSRDVTARSLFEKRAAHNLKPVRHVHVPSAAWPLEVPTDTQLPEVTPSEVNVKRRFAGGRTELFEALAPDGSKSLHYNNSTGGQSINEVLPWSGDLNADVNAPFSKETEASLYGSASAPPRFTMMRDGTPDTLLGVPMETLVSVAPIVNTKPPTEMPRSPLQPDVFAITLRPWQSAMETQAPEEGGGEPMNDLRTIG